MRVLMSGATGLIGREIGKRLVEKGHQVTALVRDTGRARQELPFPARLVKWSGKDEVPAEAMNDIQAVINLAGEPLAGGRWTHERKQRIHDSRIIVTRHLVEASLKNQTRVRAFISGSAIGYYGNRGDEVLDETAPKGEGFLADICEDWEAELNPLEGTPIRKVAVRTSVVLARHGGALEKLLPLFERGVAGHLGSGQQWMSWIHLDDIARLFVFALENETVSGALNGAAPEPVRNDRFTVELARALGRSVFLPVPEAALRLTMGEMAQMVLDSQRVVPEKAQECGFEFEHGEIVEALTSIAEPLKGGHHEILSEQWLPFSPSEVFPFYADEKNLETLTPPFLNFEVLGKSTDAIKEGTLIDYKLSLHGVPVKWQTRIDEWQPDRRFVDTQLKGPYKKWHHVHEFIPLGGGTLIRDRVTYRLPLGFFGDTFAGWKVSRDVAEIFSYRREAIDRQFGVKK